MGCMKVLIHSNVSWDLNILTSVYENDLFCAINIKAWNYIYWAITLKCTPSTLPTTYSSFDLSLYIPLDSSILYRVSISRLTQIHARKQSPNVFHNRGSDPLIFDLMYFILFRPSFHFSIPENPLALLTVGSIHVPLSLVFSMCTT